jgi:branched-chain amino acid transport system permease protein
MQEFVEFTLGGVSDGVIYAAVGLSLVLIWRATRVLNYAQGGMAMFTSYVALIVINATGNYWLGFVVALATGLIMGGVVERVVIRPAAGKPHLNTVIVTIGLLILVEGVAGMIYGSKNRSFPTPYSIVGAKVGGFDLGEGSSPSAIFTAVAVLAAAGLLAVLFRYTAVGLRMRASAFSGTVAQLMGVRVGRITTLGWALAGLIGALAGMLVTPQTFLYPNSMDSIFVLGFTAAVIGGLDSPGGAIVGGLILGVLLNYVTGYVGSNLPELAGLALLVLVLMFRPSGLFASTATRQV